MPAFTERGVVLLDGVAQPAGALYEYSLDTVTASLTNNGYGSVVGFVGGSRFGNDLWLATLGRTAVRVPNCAIGPTGEQDFGVGALTIDTAVFRGDGDYKLYVSELLTGMRKYNGSVWTTGDSGTKRGQMEVVNWSPSANIATGGIGAAGTPAYSLVATDLFGSGMYHVQGDPTVGANWSALTYVGPGTNLPLIQSCASNQVVFFGSGNGVYAVNEIGRAPNLTRWIEASASINNCTALEFHDGLIWGAHEQGLFVFSPNGERIDTGTFLNFGAKTGTMPIFGRPQALRAGPDSLYVGYYNADTETSYVGCLVKDPDGTYRWSMAEAVIQGEIVTYIQQIADTNGQPGLFIGTRGASDGKLHLRRQYLPRWGDPETDARHPSGSIFQAASDWSLNLSRWTTGRGVRFAVRRMAVETKYLGDDYPTNTVTVQLSNDDGAFVDQGTATRGSRWTGTPTTGSVVATNTQMRLVVHNEPAHPVVIPSASVFYNERPERTGFRTYPLIIAEGMTSHKDPKVTRRRLEALQLVGPLAIEDRLRGEYEGMIEDFSEVASEEDPLKQWKMQADLTISTSRTVTRYDVGDGYDVGAPYS